MIYKIGVAADFHWGAMDADKQYEENLFIIDFMKNNPLDLFVIAGDWWNSRLLVNSKAALTAVNTMYEYIELAKQNNFQLRLFDGTRSHDYDQNNIFMSAIDDTFKVFRENTFEETLPGLNCIYCPDENIDNTEYFIKYKDNIFNKPIDCMFFHGTFDILGIERKDTGDEKSIKNIVFEYQVFSKLCHIMVGGHWHDADSNGNMFYTRSPNRYKFGEDRPKGFVYFSYDTETKEYQLDRIINENTDEYRTIILDTSLYDLSGNITETIKEIDNMIISNPRMHIRVKLLVTSESPNSKMMVDTLKLHYTNNRSVKFEMENKLGKKRKEEIVKHVSELKQKYNFLYDPRINIRDKFKQFIKMKNGVEVDDEILDEVLSEYIKKEGM